MTNMVFLTLMLGLIGVVTGFLAQRSRMCFVAGLRDYILVRDTELLFGLFSFFVTVWFFTSVFYSFDLLRAGTPQYGVGGIGGGGGHFSINIRDVIRSGKISLTGAEKSSVAIGGLFNNFLIISVAGGCLIGFVSTLAGGCVLRQHVLLTQGSRDAYFYLAGFYTAVVIYYSFLFRFVIRLY
jgi:hypothetical protein